MEHSTQCPGQVYFCSCRFMVFSMTLAWYVENERYTGLEPGLDLYALFCGLKEGSGLSWFAWVGALHVQPIKPTKVLKFGT